MMQNDNFAKFQLKMAVGRSNIQFIIGRGGGGISAFVILIIL
jgi:ABC-type ATPase involved in cell division